MGRNNEFQILFYNRLLFELKTLRSALENMVFNEKQQINTSKEMLKQIQKQFYIITSNLNV